MQLQQFVINITEKVISAMGSHEGIPGSDKIERQTP